MPKRLARRSKRQRQKGVGFRRRLRLLEQPALDVAADTHDRRQRLEQLGRLAGPWADRGVVTAEQVGGDSYLLGLGKHSLQCHEVAVDVVQHCGGRFAHYDLLTTFTGIPTYANA